MALLGSKDNNGKVHVFNEITGRDGDDGLEDYDVPPPAVSVRQVEQFVREKKEGEATRESTSVKIEQGWGRYC